MKPPPPVDPSAPKNRHHRLNKKTLPWLVVLVLLAAIVFLFTQYEQARHKLQTNTPTATKQQVNDVVGRVGKLIILPTDETPRVFTVTDINKLKGLKFYENAKIGDKTLVYAKQQKAILYRPSANIIVNVAPVTIDSTTNP